MPANRLKLFHSVEERSVRAISPRSIYAIIFLILAELVAMMGCYATILQISGALDNLERYRAHFGWYPPSEIYFLLTNLAVNVVCFLLAVYIPMRIARTGRKRYRVHVSATEGFGNVE